MCYFCILQINNDKSEKGNGKIKDAITFLYTLNFRYRWPIPLEIDYKTLDQFSNY